MISLLSVLTSVKDYIEIIHKVLEGDPSLFQLKGYDELGFILTYFFISIKEFLIQFLTLKWIKDFWSLPIIVPDIASAMISEISILDGAFHNAFSFLETPLSYGSSSSPLLYSFEKFFIGFLNSLFLILPTSVTHIITLRRFIMQGVGLGYIAGLGTIAGNLLWLTSVIFGWRFFVIPWLSFDIFRYLFGFALLVKYLSDCPKEKRMVFEDFNNSKKFKIFLLNFLLCLTEQTCIYPFISNISISAESSLFETFPSENIQQFILIHGAYLFGIFVGSYSLLLFSCWFWEYPAFTIYLWFQTKSNYRFTTKFFDKVLNNLFGYLTMLAAISSIPYYGLDYTLTKPLGLVPQDRLLNELPSLENKTGYEKLVPEISFLDFKPTNINLRAREGIKGRRERWRQNHIKYEAFDAALYDQGIYEFLTIEDLNYGFDRFWLKRKMRSHSTYYRAFPTSIMREIKKQFIGPKSEFKKDDFFLLLFEQYYHPNFHKKTAKSMINNDQKIIQLAKDRLSSFNIFTQTPKAQTSKSLFSDQTSVSSPNSTLQDFIPLAKQPMVFKGPGPRGPAMPAKAAPASLTKQPLQARAASLGKAIEGYRHTLTLESKPTPWVTALRKFVRKFNTRIKTSEIVKSGEGSHVLNDKLWAKPIYSKRWKHFYSNIWRYSFEIPKSSSKILSIPLVRNLSKKLFLESTNFKNELNLLSKKQTQYKNFQKFYKPNMLDSPSQNGQYGQYGPKNHMIDENFKKTLAREKLSKKDRQTLRYRTLLKSTSLDRIGVLACPTGCFATRTPALPSEATQRESQGTARQNTYVNYKVRNLLHPLNFYLQKEEAFRRKLKFYGSSIFRKLSVGNTAPYFRSIMKRGFYYHKQTLRWKRTDNAAALRRFLRKNSRIPKKLEKTNLNELQVEDKRKKFFIPLAKLSNSNISPNFGNQSLLSKSFLGNVNINPTEQQTFESLRKAHEMNSVVQTSLEQEILENQITKPINSYSLVGARPTRYRFQIYKDVLQHWYYTPFNRLLLKFDIDAFINRQPKTHFLTKKEEQLLHLKRVLLSEHYDTLRWYTFMQHYRSMKTQIGGTKSFASRVYNQQFQGTFKKIRHLFAITPSQTNALTESLYGINSQSKQKNSLFPSWNKSSVETPIVLKFDQPLYNEYRNTTKIKTKQSGPILQKSIFHEELLVPVKTSDAEKGLTNPTPGVLKTSQRNKDKLLKLSEKTGSVPKSEAILAILPIKLDFVPRELNLNDLVTKSFKIVGNYLLKTENDRKLAMKLMIQENNYSEFLSLNKVIFPESIGRSIRGTDSFVKDVSRNKPNQVLASASLTLKGMQQGYKEELWFQFLKQSKKRVNNRFFLKNYVNYRLTKREKLGLKKQKKMKTRLEKLKKWLAPTTLFLYLPKEKNQNLILTRGLGKTLTKGTKFIENKNLSTMFNEQSNAKPLLLSQLEKQNNLSIAEQKSFGQFGQFAPRSYSRAKGLVQSNTIEAQVSPSSGGNKTFQSRFGVASLIENKVENRRLLRTKASLKTIQKILEKPNLEFVDASQKNSSVLRNTISSLAAFDKKNKKFMSEANTTLLKKSLTIARQGINNIFNSMIEKSKKICVFVNERPNRLKQSLWKKRQKVKNKNKAKRKRRLKVFPGITKADDQKKNKDIVPDYKEKYSDIFNKEQSILITYDSNNLLALNQFNSKNLSQFSEQALKSALTREGYTKIIPRLKESDFTETVKKFIYKSLKSDEPIVFKKYKTLTGSQISQRPQAPLKRNSYILSFLFKYNLRNKKRKYKFLRPKNGQNNLKNMSPYKKLRILKTGGLLNALLSNNSEPFGNDLGNFSEASLIENKKRFELTESKLKLTKQKKKRKVTRRQKRFKRSRPKKRLQRLVLNRFKFKKQKAYRKGKLQKLEKQIKRLKSNIALQVWWWQTYLPKFQFSFEKKSLDQKEIVKDLLSLESQFKPLLSLLNNSTIKTLDTLTSKATTKGSDNKQASLMSFQSPYATSSMVLLSEATRSESTDDLAVPEGTPSTALLSEATRRESMGGPRTPKLFLQSKEAQTQDQNQQQQKQNLDQLSIGNQNLFELKTLYQNFFIPQSKSIIASNGKDLLNSLKTYEATPINPLPFYAGWDEVSRKLVITNRFLSRRDAGFSLQNLNHFTNITNSLNMNNKNELEFSLSPLFGLNKFYSLYWQNEIPISTFNIDQDNSNRTSFYAPIGWRRFEFRHSILNLWLNQRSTKSAFISRGTNPSQLFFASEAAGLNDNSKLKIAEEIKTEKTLKIRCPKTLDNSESAIRNLNLNCFMSDTYPFSTNLFEHNKFSLVGPIQSKEKRKIQKFKNRRLKKNKNKTFRLMVGFSFYKLQGPLLTEILPSHYLSIFNAQYRLPRHRYLKYKLTKDNTLQKPFPSIIEYNNFITKSNKNMEFSFTFRKRSKPKRKFHRKRIIKSGGLIIPRRRKFITSMEFEQNSTKKIPIEKNRWRPLNQSILTLPKSRLKTDTIRRRKIRRRIFKQVFKPMSRFQPRFGGYIWPGDYPKLELLSLPKLLKENEEKITSIKQKRSRKEKRRLKGVIGDLPHKYLLKKHNVLVLKKKLEKAQRKNKLLERTKELKLLFQS